jgi:hypothetical protein
MREIIQVPIRIINNIRWGQLSVFGERHEFCGEKFELRDSNFSFAGGHRVRIFSAKKNVHWKIPEGIQLDISQVQTSQPPRRMPRK